MKNWDLPNEDINPLDWLRGFWKPRAWKSWLKITTNAEDLGEKPLGEVVERRRKWVESILDL